MLIESASSDKLSIESEVATSIKHIYLYLQQKTDLFLQNYVFGTLSEHMIEKHPRSAEELRALTKEIKKTKAAGEARTNNGVSNNNLSPDPINSPALEIFSRKKERASATICPREMGNASRSEKEENIVLAFS